MSRRVIGSSGWEYDDPFGGIGDVFDPGGPTDPIDPGPGGGGGGGGYVKHFTRLLDPAVDEHGTWTVRLRHRGQDDEQYTITVDHPETVQNLRQTRIPFQLINRTFAQALLMMQLRIRINSGQARIEFDRTFRELTGAEDQTLSVTDRLRDINLQEFNVEIGNDAGMPTITVGLDLEDRGVEIGLPGPDVDLENLAIACRIQIAFGYPRGPDFFETAMRRQDGDVVRRSISLFTFLDMNPDINGLWASFADAILWFGGSSLDEEVQSAVDDAELRLSAAVRKAETYVQDVIMHLVDRDDVLFRISADDQGILVTHHRRPSIRDFLDGVVVGPDGVIVDDAGTNAIAAVTITRDTATPRTRDQLLALPTGTSIQRIMREGEIDHIVVLMMENRSFDHMLGYRRFAHPDTNGLTGSESNPFANGAPYEVHHLAQTAGIPSPAHGFTATLRQIDDGSMSGFVESYSQRSSDLQLVMGYYDHGELPIYEFLSNNFAICDSWHSAHPGETQCNRIAALTGVAPELTNFDLSDNRLGYYNGSTVLDYLTRASVSGSTRKATLVSCECSIGTASMSSTSSLTATITTRTSTTHSSTACAMVTCRVCPLLIRALSTFHRTGMRTTT